MGTNQNQLVRRRAAASACIAVAGLVAGCGSSGSTGSAAPATPAAAASTATTVFGTVSVQGSLVAGDSGPVCQPETGFSDMKAGAQAVLTTDEGRTLASTSMTVYDEPLADSVVPQAATCVFAINFGKVQFEDNTQFFKLVAGRREPYVLKRADLYGFKLSLSG